MCYMCIQQVLCIPCVYTVPVLGSWFKLLALDINVLCLLVSTSEEKNVCNYIIEGSVINGMRSLVASLMSL